ncbi:MAG: kynureninase [Acidimicrobiia bacterium]|nr:kynureninase [Acidimicrobiia bacterium]
MALDDDRPSPDADVMAGFVDRFHHPVDDQGRPLAYLCGHSLGLAPRRAAAAVDEVLDRWARQGVEGHFGDSTSWYRYDEPLTAPMAALVGAGPADVALMGTLTSNLHLLLASFFSPVRGRDAVLIEASAFPSDRYAVETHLRWHGLDPASHLIEWPTSDGGLLDERALDEVLQRHGHRIGCALIGAVNYASGQRLDVGAITARLHQHGVLAGFDLAHAAGNIELDLLGDHVDFAAWCTYKYLNSGPGAVAGLFVAPRHGADLDRVRLGGWWGNDPATRFDMDVERHFVPVSGAAGWRQSNPPILSLAPVGVSLELFTEAGMTALAARSVHLTSALHDGLATIDGVEVLTPADPARRGAQLSIRIAEAERVAAALRADGVVVDVRRPDIIRLAPVPLYNTLADVDRAVDALARTGPRV